jgi:hypothetical protein
VKPRRSKILISALNDEMPLALSTWMHREAKLSENEKKALEDWINNTLESL